MPTPGLWTYANNTTNTRFQDASGPGHALPSDDEALARVAARQLERVAREWGLPATALICGGGWSFGGERAWLDHHAFPLTPQRIQAALLAAYPECHARVLNPGDSVTMKDGRLCIDEPPRHAFLESLPPEQWPAREHAGDGARLSDYAPACGRRALDRDQLGALCHELRDLARHLYGGPVFGELYSLPTDPIDGRVPALGLALRTEGPTIVLRYEPSGCRFVEHPCADPMTELMSGIECWGSDLLALLRGEIGPTALCYAGRMRVWNADARRLRISPHVLWTFAHPLRRPAAAAALYQRLLSAEPDDVPLVRGSGQLR